MIDLSFNIALPWDVEFKNFWSRSWATPLPNKFIELEFHTTETLVGVNFLWTTRRDHAGIDIEISWLGFCAHLNFYDNRHWDSENNCWAKYE